MMFLLVATACSGELKRYKEMLEGRKTIITIGAMTSTDVIPFVIIEKNGLDEKYNIDLNIEMFTAC